MGYYETRIQLILDSIDDWIITSKDTKFGMSNILHLRFKIYSLKLQHSHLFSDYCS